MMKLLLFFFSIVGMLTMIYGIVGMVIDITSFDQTKGGYQYPYEGWTGKPVDWDSMDITKTGLVKRGYVVDVLVNGRTGMISFKVLGTTFDWQTFSDRALMVHKPKEALLKKGFKPEF